MNELFKRHWHDWKGIAETSFGDRHTVLISIRNEM